jgi:hypothetical protein
VSANPEVDATAEANALRAVLLDEYWREANEARNEALRVLEAARQNFEAAWAMRCKYNDALAHAEVERNNARTLREKWEQDYRDLQADLSELHEYRRFFSHPLERDLVLGKAILPR